MGAFNYGYDQREKKPAKRNAFGMTALQSYGLGIGLILYIVFAVVFKGITAAFMFALWIILLPFKILGALFEIRLLTVVAGLGLVALVIGAFIH